MHPVSDRVSASSVFSEATVDWIFMCTVPRCRTLILFCCGPREKNNILSLKNTITDDDIVFPESFDADVHKMMTNWYLQNYAVLDADVENKSYGEVSEETYIRRLAAIPSVIEMPYNQVVRKHIERYVYRSRTLVEEMLGMSLYYMPIFEQALDTAWP